MLTMFRRGILPSLSSWAPVLVGSCLAASQADAAVLYQTGFENPPFTPGPIAGQDGWSVFGPSAGSFVENTFAFAGTQAVEVNPALFPGQSGPFKEVDTSSPIVTQSAEIYLKSSTNETSWQYATLGPGFVNFAAGIDIDVTTGAIHSITQGFPVIGTFTRNVWHNVSLDLNYATDTYAVVLDGSFLASNIPFCGNSGAFCTGSSTISSYGDGFFDSFGGISGQNDVGYIDNYSVSAVPEPASLTLIGSGLLALAFLRRRASKSWPARHADRTGANVQSLSHSGSDAISGTTVHG